MSFFSKNSTSQNRPAQEIDPRIRIIREIEEGQPINPRHAQPASIDQNGFTALICDADREAFTKTADFGVRFNDALTCGGFRIQEIPDPLLKHLHGPALGRNFDVYFNRLKVGSLTLKATTELFSNELTGARIQLELEHPHLFDYGDLRTLLQLIAHATSDRTEKDFETKEIEVDRAMAKVLWDAMCGRDPALTLEWAQSGPGVSILSNEYKGKSTDD